MDQALVPNRQSLWCQRRQRDGHAETAALAAQARAYRTATAQLLTRACMESERLVSNTGTRVPSTRPAVPAPASQVSSL
ncbi:hypothetical protein G6F35_018207 [Rhizopus arrhizus]|nr:hypothetical protein G6F35_018207 [Rhizopus arrhizus]